MKKTTLNRSTFVTGVIRCNQSPAVAVALINELSIKHPSIFTRLYKDYISFKAPCQETMDFNDLEAELYRMLEVDPISNKIKAIKLYREKTGAKLGESAAYINSIIERIKGRRT